MDEVGDAIPSDSKVHSSVLLLRNDRRGIQAIRSDLSFPQAANGHEILMARRKKRAVSGRDGQIE